MTVPEFWEFSNRPENAGRRFELVRGEVIEWPIPYKKHGVVCARASWFLDNYARETGVGYVVINNAGVILPLPPASVLGPDVAYYTDATADGEFSTGWSESLPRLAVEVIGPEEDTPQLRVKIDEYLRNGVQNVWLINYQSKDVTVYQPGRPPAVASGTDELPLRVVSESDAIWQDRNIPVFRCRVGDFFRLPGERVPVSDHPAI